MQSAAARHNRRKQAEGMTIPLGVRDPARRVTEAKTDHHCQRRFEESRMRVVLVDGRACHRARRLRPGLNRVRAFWRPGRAANADRSRARVADMEQSAATQGGSRVGAFGSRPMRMACFLAALLASSAVGVVAPAPARADSTVSSCDDATLRAAIEAGGVVTFSVNCSAVMLASPFDIPAGLDVDLEANGHTVALDGRNSVRHFIVSGGSLTINGLTLQN